MANFFLIDHSLRQSGGHHFDYVQCVAQASNELGFETTIGAHRNFKRESSSDNESLDRLGAVRRVFHQTTYQPDSYLAGLQHLTRSNSSRALVDNYDQNALVRTWNHFKNTSHRRRREKFVRQFASDCEWFFRSTVQSPGDHVFLTTVSELELMGLAIYLAAHPKTLHAQWHLQFHFNLFDGRTPEYDGQGHLTNAIRACFLAALARVPYHSLNFYTTSETLVDQYSRLGVGNFEVLPYPVSTDFSTNLERSSLDFRDADLAGAIQKMESQESASASYQPKLFLGSESLAVGDSLPIDFGPCEVEGGPEIEEQAIRLFGGDGNFKRTLKITCPGELRREKGHVEYLQPLINDIWESHLSTGEVQIVVQRPIKKWHSKKQKLELSQPSGDSIPSGTQEPIEYYSHPLKHDDYVDLIRSTDCGLLFYDSRVYFSRRAGVLGELLASGKPVIVPAGSWLAEQVQGPIFEHVDRVLKENEVVRALGYRDFKWNSSNVPMPGGVLSFDQGHHPFEFSIDRDEDETALVLKFDWHWPKKSGVFCRIDVTQMDKFGDTILSGSQVVGHRKSNRKVSCVFPLDSQTKSIQFSLSNAFHGSTASISRVELNGIAYPNANTELPRGSVGIVASDKEDLANCIDEIVRHFDHYRESAVRFSSNWYEMHDPKSTVSHLVSSNQSVRRVA